MIISQTPFRISFFGGGSDYPAWYREHGGSTLVTTIDKYCRISCRYLPPFFEYKHRLVYSKIEMVNKADELQHPSARAVLQTFGSDRGLEIHHDGDLPARSGLGSSSSFTVGLINTVNALEGKVMSKHELARKALYIEQDVLKEAVGSQDQVAAAYGGFNRVDFFPDDSFNVTPVILGRERKEVLQDHLMLFFTGFQRNAVEVAQKKISNFKNRQNELRSMQALVEEAMKILIGNETPIEEIGKLLHETWQLKRSIAEGVSNSAIDEIYDTAIRAGAMGGKILGAGGGGFMLFFAKPSLQTQVRKALSKLIHVGFRFETGGSKIVLYDPNF